MSLFNTSNIGPAPSTSATAEASRILASAQTCLASVPPSCRDNVMLLCSVMVDALKQASPYSSKYTEQLERNEWETRAANPLQTFETVVATIQADLKRHEEGGDLPSLWPDPPVGKRAKGEVEGCRRQYDEFLQKCRESGRTLTPKAVRCIPMVYHRFSDLPDDVRKLSPGVHGTHYEDGWIIVRESLAHLLLVCRKRNVHGMEKFLARATEWEDLEISLPLWGQPGYKYWGKFGPALRWLPFIPEVVGKLPELFVGYSPTKVHGRQEMQYQYLKLHWGNPHSDLVFCVLEYTGFNQAYFDLLEGFAVKHEKEQQRKRTGGRRLSSARDAKRARVA